MKIRQLLSAILIIALISAVFTSCKYRLRWVKAEEEESLTEDAGESVSAAEEPTEAPAAGEPATENPLEGTGIEEITDFRMAAMDKEAVISLYKSVLNDVKVRCPGFTRSETQVTDGVTAGKGRLQLADRILNLAAEEILNSHGAGEGVVKVSPHSDVEVLEKFPAYGKSYGCGLQNLSIINTAVCYTDGKTYKLVITVADTLNAEPGQGDFSEIMTPISRQAIADGIREYFLVLDRNQYQFDFNYTGNEIICEIDVETGRILSLTQKSVVEVDVDLDMDLLLFKTNFIEAHGTIINRLEFSDFIWD